MLAFLNKTKLKQSVYALCSHGKLPKTLLRNNRIRKYTKTLLEEELVAQAECGGISKEEAVKLGAQRWPKLAARDDETIDQIFASAPDCAGLTEEERESIREDIHFCRYAYGFMPHEYISFQLQTKEPGERKAFISESDHMRYVYTMNDPADLMIFNDKMRTYEQFREYYHREVVSISSEKDRPVFEDYVRRHPVFVKKQVFESCGNSIEKIDARANGVIKEELFQSFLAQEKVVLEELVQQGQATAVFNHSSVNTIRCITFLTKQGVKTPYCFMKIGRAGSFIDNGGAGGILVGIDEKTGITNTAGVDELRNIYETHPDNGTPFRGHQLPDWEQMLSICREMAEKIPSVPFVGWDLAYTDRNEWIVIEGNGMSQFIGPQTIWQRGIKDEVEALIQEMV